MCPAQFPSSWEQYAEDYCFIQNTYFYPMSERLPFDDAKRYIHPVTYYQWVPVALLIQALLFYLPNRIWELTLRKEAGELD